jgi:hypothetical protein
VNDYPEPCNDIHNAIKDLPADDPWRCFGSIHLSICIEVIGHASIALRHFNSALVREFLSGDIGIRTQYFSTDRRRWRQVALSLSKGEKTLHLELLRRFARAHIGDDFPEILCSLHHQGVPVNQGDYDDLLPTVMKAFDTNQDCVHRGIIRHVPFGRPIARRITRFFVNRYRKLAWREAQQRLPRAASGR